jgi:hypothetical protein
MLHFISILNFDWLKIEACFIQIQFLLDMEEKLIEQVRLHEVLFNYKLTSYRDQHIRQEAWEEIGRELQMKG